MYQRILATLDGSRFSEEILPWAAGMAASLGATLELLRVVEKESASAEATDYVQRLAAQYAAHGQCRPTRGTVAEAILLEARAAPDPLGADLMVLAVARPEDLEQAGDSGRDQVYVRAHAQELAKRFGISVNWDMLQGEPVGAIVGYLQGRQDTILAMTTRGRSALGSAFIGSVTAGCLRKAGVPVLMRAP
jgi:nucleotide-binding universal stress UspA family protein